MLSPNRSLLQTKHHQYLYILDALESQLLSHVPTPSISGADCSLLQAHGTFLHTGQHLKLCEARYVEPLAISSEEL